MVMSWVGYAGFLYPTFPTSKHTLDPKERSVDLYGIEEPGDCSYVLQNGKCAPTQLFSPLPLPCPRTPIPHFRGNQILPGSRVLDGKGLSASKEWKRERMPASGR